MSRVLRFRPGDELELLDGQGRKGRFSVRAVNKRNAELVPLEIAMFERPPGNTIALGYNKGLRRSWLLEKAVELEAGAVWFWQAERSQGKMSQAGKDDEAARSWQAQLIAGAKQCSNPWLPELRTLPRGAEELAELAEGFNRAYVLWEEADPRAMLTQDMLEKENSLYVLGPEGGISPAEIEIMEKAGFSVLSLGARILRWETAALLCMGLAWWGNNLKTAGGVSP